MSDFPRPTQASGWSTFAARGLVALGLSLMLSVGALMGSEGSKTAQIAIGAWIAGPAAICFAASRRLLSATVVLLSFLLLFAFAT
jgi:uncharacterized membrane protein